MKSDVAGVLGPRMCNRLASSLLALAAIASGGAPACHAGLSASQVVVVVNATSQRSRTVANHYVHLRNIPAINVVVLSGVPNSEQITVAEFREKILMPLLTELDRRKLAGSVHCIAYSADFPTAIDISKDLEAVGQLPQVLTRVASINSLTYYYRWVQGGDPSYVGLGANLYARRPVEAYFQNPGGDAFKGEWDAIGNQIQEKRFAAAAKSLEAMLGTQPHQFPLAYLAASQFALAGDRANALRMLGSAIAKGWTHGQYLRNDARFDKIRDDPEFQALELSLDQTSGAYQPAVGFDSRVAWSPNGVRIPPNVEPKPSGISGMNYMLSTVLAVTRGEGTTVSEAIAALERSSSADFTQPDGSFYFCLTGDVRTTTRQPGFDAAVAHLKAMGFNAEVLKTPLPMEKPLVLGACLGVAQFDWSSSNSLLAPGSIAENLTSLGATMSRADGQTKLTELIKAGAAGSSGTVTEPYAVQAKFPHPMLYAHYAQGACLAEAFYLNVTGPYQLLIVGDPLCQPFANPREMKLDTVMRTIVAGRPVTLQLEKDTSQAAMPVRANWKPALEGAAFSVSLDSAQPRNAVFRDKLQITLTGDEPNGYHELRLAVISSGELAIRREIALPLWVGDRDCIRLEAPAKASLNGGEKTFVKVSAPGAERISLWHDNERLGTFSRSEAQFALSPEELGLGPVRLQAQAKYGDKTVRSAFHVLEIQP